MTNMPTRLRQLNSYQKTGLPHELLEEAAREIEQLLNRVSELEQCLSQAGDNIEMQEAEQRGFERGRADGDTSPSTAP